MESLDDEKMNPQKPQRNSSRNSKINPEPLGCGNHGTEGISWLNSFVTGMANSHIIDDTTTKKHFGQLAHIINDVTDKFQEITLDTNYFFMQDFKKIKEFGEVCNKLCNIIKRYTDDINTAKAVKENKRDRLTKDDLERFFRTITFYYEEEFKTSYEKAKKLLDQRKEREPKVFHFNKIFRMALMNTLNKLWEVKLYIYIASKIFYNYYIYVFPLPISDMLDQIIRIIGLLCFTYASDPILLHPILKILKNITSLFGGIVYLIISRLLGSIFKDSKLLKIINILMTYGYTYYTFGWLSKIIVSICKTFTVLKPIFNAASSSGISTLKYMKDLAVKTADSAVKTVQDASAEAITLMIAAGPAIMEGMSKFFSNYILNYVISFWDYLKSGLQSQIKSTILTTTLQSIFDIWKTKSNELVKIEENTGNLEIYNKEKYNLVPISKDIIALIIPELIDEVNKPLPVETDIIITDEDIDIDAIRQVQTQIQNPLFQGAVIKKSDGTMYLDPNKFQKNFETMTTINFEQVIDDVKEKITGEAQYNFGKFYEENIGKAGLPLLLHAMTEYTNSKDDLNQPLLILFLMGTEEVMNTFITKNTQLSQKILLFIALIALFFLNIKVV